MIRSHMYEDTPTYDMQSTVSPQGIFQPCSERNLHIVTCICVHNPNSWPYSLAIPKRMGILQPCTYRSPKYVGILQPHISSHIAVLMMTDKAYEASE